jgi:hypothetical protein
MDNEMVVWGVLYNFCLKYFSCRKNSARYYNNFMLLFIVYYVQRSSCEGHAVFVRLIKFDFSRQILKISSNIKFH